MNDIPLGITLPDDMPVPVATMLQTTISEVWADYDGDPLNAEEFWNFLVGEQCQRAHV